MIELFSLSLTLLIEVQNLYEVHLFYVKALIPTRRTFYLPYEFFIDRVNLNTNNNNGISIHNDNKYVFEGRKE